MPKPLNYSSNNKQQDISRFKSLFNDLKRDFPNDYTQTTAIVSVADQQLYLTQNQTLIICYQISTAEAGVGNKSGSYQTPLGIHRIAEKFGDEAPLGSIFKARENTHQIADILSDPTIRSEQDNITSRILWLEGLEEGFNKGNDEDNNNVDSYSRYIYIHGTDEEGLLGKAASHGCVRMANRAVIALFDNVEVGDLVVILDH